MGPEIESINTSCLAFEFSKSNANAISALLASLDTHSELQHLAIHLPRLKFKVPENIEKLQSYKKIIIAFSVYSTQYLLVKEKIRQYRELLEGNDFLIIAGGPHAIGSPKSMLSAGCDVVCIGEGELVIREIILAFIENRSIEEINGIAYFTPKREIRRNPKGTPVNLDDFPPFSIKHRLIRPIEITRGCGWKCRFCQIRSKGIPVKHRSISEVHKYVKIIHEYFKDKRTDIRFISPNALSYGSKDGVTLDLQKVEMLLAGIRSIIGNDGKIYFGSFPSEVRPETITDESVRILKTYTNVKKIIVGGQSGSNKILELVDRGHDVKETERAVDLLIKAGFAVDVDIIFGLPGEEDEDVKLTMEHMDRLVQLGATIHSHTFLPLVGTPLASSPPGIVNLKYLPQIKKLQGKGHLSGQHVKQENDAKIMANLRLIHNNDKQIMNNE